MWVTRNLLLIFLIFTSGTVANLVTWNAGLVAFTIFLKTSRPFTITAPYMFAFLCSQLLRFSDFWLSKNKYCIQISSKSPWKHLRFCPELDGQLFVVALEIHLYSDNLRIGNTDDSIHRDESIHNKASSICSWNNYTRDLYLTVLSDVQERKT